MRTGKLLIASLCALLVASCGADPKNSSWMSELSESADLSSAPQIVVKTKQKGSDFLRFASENESDTAQTSSEFKYGVYGETEIELLGLASTADVSWYVSEDTLPPGLELEDSITESVLLFGTPEFQGQWCFVISADTSDIQVDNEICVVAEDNEELLYPRFETDRYLGDGVVGQRYSQKIKLVKQYDDFGQAIRLTGSFENGLIPMGLSLFGSLYKYEFEFRGSPRTAGIYKFVFKIADTNETRTYKQFQLEVTDGAQAYDCPSGYYFDDAVGHCVQSAGAACPAGTYYDDDSGSCYKPTPPITISCSAGSYYDPSLNTCVLVWSPRCPTNYRWDNYYNRCVRLAHTCPIGTKFNYSKKRCQPIYSQQCRPGTYWNSFKRRCVPNRRACRKGSYWSNKFNRCVPAKNVRPPIRPPVRPPVRPPLQPPMRPPVRPPVRPPMQPPMRPPMRPPVRPPMQPPMRPPVRPPVRPPMQPPMRPPVRPPVRPPMQPPMRPPVRPPVRPPMQLPMRPPVRPPVRPPMQPPMRPPMRPPVRPPMRPPMAPMAPMRPSMGMALTQSALQTVLSPEVLSTVQLQELLD